jgi:integrase
VHRDDQIRPLTDEQIKALLLAAKRLQHPKRNEALLLLMCDTGLRASEVCGLTVGDLDLDKATSGL